MVQIRKQVRYLPMRIDITGFTFILSSLSYLNKGEISKVQKFKKNEVIFLL